MYTESPNLFRQLPVFFQLVDWPVSQTTVRSDQRRIFIFSFGGGWINIWGGAAACFGRGVLATPGEAKEKV
jgi:hypothetical protein